MLLKINQSHIVNTLAADDLVLQGTRSSTDIVLIQFPQNNPFSTCERLRPHHTYFCACSVTQLCIYCSGVALLLFIEFIIIQAFYDILNFYDMFYSIRIWYRPWAKIKNSNSIEFEFDWKW